MAYRRVTKEELDAYLAKNPGGTYRVNGQEQRAPFQDEDQGALMKFLTGLSKPLRAVPGSLWSAVSGKAEDNPFLTQREEYDLGNNTTDWGTKQAVGLGSYLVPGGGGKAASTFGRVGTGVLRGTAAGAMGGYGYSEQGEELESTLKGGALGGLLGGVFQAGSELSKTRALTKASKKIATQADDFEVSGYIKKIGTKPTNSQGKMNLARDSMALSQAEGATINNADDLLKWSDDLLVEYGPVANKYASEATQLGVKIDVEEVLDPLKKLLDKTKTPQLKKPLEQVIKSAREAAGPSRMIDPETALALRREWGNLGNWNQFTPTAEQTVAKAWERVYNSMNDALDSSFSSLGMNNFRDVNHVLKTAIEQQKWARQAIATFNKAPVWTDMAQDALAIGGAITGGGPGALAGVAASKVLQNKGNQMVGSTMRGGANLLGNAGKAIPAISKAGQRAIPGLAGMFGQSEEGVPAGQGGLPSEGIPEQEEQGLNPQNLVLAQLVASGDLSVTEAKYLSQLLGIGQNQNDLLVTAIDELERLYGVGTPQSLSLGDKSTGVGGLVSKAAATGRKAFDQGFADRKTAYDQQRAIAVGIINKAREAGVLNEGEYQVMISNMPNEYTTEKAAQDWFTNIRRMLLGKTSSSGSDTQDVSALYDMLNL